MDDNPKNPGDSSGDVEELRRRLAEAEGTLDAIRRGMVDAFVVEDGQGERVYTLKGADKAYSVFIETINEGLVALDSSNNILYSNTAFAHLVGLSPDRVSCSSAHRFIQEEDRPLFDRLMAQSIGGLTSRREFSILTETGDLVPMYLSFSNLEIAGINGACIVLTDLTEQKHAARDLQEQYSVLSSIIESSNSPIFSIDADYLYSSFNSAHAAAMKALYDVDIELGKSILAYMTVKEDRIEAKRNLDRALQGGQFVEATYSGDEGRSRKYFEVSHNPIRNKRGGVTGVAVFAIDNTESKRAEEALRKSEEKYRLLYDNAGEAIFSYDPELRLTDINRVGCEAIGYSREEMLGKNVLELNILHPRDLELAATLISRHFAGENVLKTEYTFIRKDGSERLFSVIGAAIRDPDGSLQSITNMCRDITERKAAEEALRKSEEKFREFAENLPEVVFEADSMGRFLYVNSNTLEDFGYTEEELYSGSVNVLDMIAEEDRKQAAQRMQKILSEGPQGSNEYMARRKDGSTFPAIISTLPVVKDGITVGLRGVLTNTTAQKEAEEALRRANEKLEGYAHTVSHDLRGPLSAAGAAIDLIKDMREKPLTDDVLALVDEVLDIVASGVDRAITMTEDLLALAEAGQAPATAEPVEISGVVRAVLEERKMLLKERGVQVNVDDDLGVAAMDPTHAYQVFSNLIGNAIKHNDSENPEIHVSRQGETGPGALRYLVKDNGPGIPEGAEEDIFLPFHKGPNSTDTGIGLSIVDKVVRLYGGQVRAYNDGGACFEFTLPIYSSQGP